MQMRVRLSYEMKYVKIIMVFYVEYQLKTMSAEGCARPKQKIKESLEPQRYNQ